MDHKDNGGNTALLIATNNEELETDKLLVEYGANVNHENNEGKTALIRAIGVL